MLFTPEKESKLKHKFKNFDKIYDTYSQAYQDIFVLMMLDGKMNGTYLEIGAGHPITLSNTYLLEKKFNWSGLSIDIVQSPNYKTLRKNNYLVTDALTVDFEDELIKYNLPNQIDYLSIDMEPSINTFNALKRLPHDKFRFSVITFEHDHYSGDPFNVLENSRNFLRSLGYKLVASNICNAGGPNSPFEDWYVDPKIVSEDLIQKITMDDQTSKFCETIIYNS